MPFDSYQKIAETTKDWQLEHTKQLSKVPWCVTEKVHGANLCFIQSKEGLQVAKRKAILQEGEEFFGYQTVKVQLSSALADLFEVLKVQYNATHSYVYGELFGGYYPHPDVQEKIGVQAVQTGVYYAPKISFIAFDLAISDGVVTSYLDYTKAIALFKQVNLFYAQPLLVGSLTEALEYNERFPTTIPRLLGLPELPNNVAEGIVIKPMQELLVKTNKGLVRPLLKKKIAEFAEDERFHQAEKWTSPAKQEDSYVLSWLEYEMRQYLNINRLQSAISKMGDLHTHQTEIKQLLTEDVWEKLSEQHQEKIHNLSTEDKSLLGMLLNELSDDLINNYSQWIAELHWSPSFAVQHIFT